MIKIIPHLLGVSLFVMVVAANAQGREAAGVAHVDSGTVSLNPEDRNLVVACVMSELGEWNRLDSVNVKDKAVAISYVILRRTLDGTPKGQHTVKETIMAHDQFYGISLKDDGSGRYKGKPEVHAALASLDSAYRSEILNYAKRHRSTYVKAILHLLPSDTTTGDDAMQFQRALRAAQAGVDGVLSGREKDTTNGATFFGGVGDIYKTKEHQPSRILAVVGSLGHFSSVKALVADPEIHSESYRLQLRDKQGVDALFFFR
jgi:hypothetical protein